MTDQNLDYQQLALALLSQTGVVSQKTVPSSTPTIYYAQGPGGLFSDMNLNKALFSAMILPRVGVQASLPAVPTAETNPLYGIITGVTATSGEEPTGVCDDPPTAGVTKLCTHSFVLGRFSRQSRVFDVDRAGKLTHANGPKFEIYGNPLNGAGNNPGMPTIPGGARFSAIANNEAAKALFEMGVAWARDFAAVTFTGNPANNTAGGGYKEFYGLDILINTGYRDAETGVACPAADSIVRTFGNRDVVNHSALLVRTIASIMRNLKSISSRANLSPVQWRIAMSFGLFYEITEYWPVSYLTYRALAVPTGSNNVVLSSDVEKMRDEMRGDLYNYTGQFLLIDGQKIPVVIDDAIVETQVGPSFQSDIYFIPYTVLGGMPVTYWEHFDYDAPGGAMEFANYFAPGDSYYTTDGGRFMWHKKPPTNFCVQLLAKIEPRLLLLTPYLAARLTDVQYTPLEHERSAFTSSGYFVDGGKYIGSSPSYYSPTA